MRIFYYSVKMYFSDGSEVCIWRNTLDFDKAKEIYNGWCEYQSNKIVLEMTMVDTCGTSTMIKAVYDPKEGESYGNEDL